MVSSGIKLVPVLFAAILIFDCGGHRRPPCCPTPTPTPTATPTPTPSETPRIKPTPYPTPVVDLAPYLHEQGGPAVTINVSGVEDVGAAINKADDFAGPGKLVITGGGAIKTQVVLHHDSDWTGEYSCETQTLEGCVLLHNNVKAEGKNATFYEPTHFEGQPAITVFQAYGPAKNNYASAENITVKGFKIVGRQPKTDGGVRQAISFGNCKNPAAIENDLSGIASIGIQFGGGAAEGNHAENVLAYRNKLRRFAAAAIALVNVKGAIVTENDIADPGRSKTEPGGISGVDIETNDTNDCAKDIKIFNNRIGYGNAARQSIGNGILGQNVYKTPCSGGLLIANNIIDGHEGHNGLDASWLWGLSGGLYFVGNWPGGLVVNNTVIRALQPGLSLYGVTGLTLQDDWLISSGGGGSAGIYLEGSSDNAFIRDRLFVDSSITPGSTAEWIQCDPTSGINSFVDVEHRGVFCRPETRMPRN